MKDDAERKLVVDSLQALMFSLRPDEGPRGQAWVLGMATEFCARAILATAGAGEVDTVIEVAHQELRRMVYDEKAKAMRESLKVVAR